MGLDQLAINVHNLNLAGKCKVGPAVAAERQHDGQQHNDQKHKGSSTEEEPYERAILHQ